MATIGPATRTVETMEELIDAGVDVFRFNFSHGSHAEHAENVAMTREAAKRSGKEVGILGDLPGPKLRISDVEDGMIGLQSGSDVTLTTEPVIGTPDRISVSYDGLPAAVGPGDEVYLADGRIRLRVRECDVAEIRCAVEVGGRIASHQGLNVPGAEMPLPAAGREDLEWVDFAVEQKIDLLAISFVRRAEDITPVERRVRTSGADIPVIAKIEKPQAAERAEEIVKAVTAGVMIARGDLGIELPIEKVPIVQRKLLALAGGTCALDHRDPDARLDGGLAAPDEGRGLGRRQRHLPGHRRGDAVGGDGDRRLPARGGADDGSDRARGRARAPLRQLGLQPGEHRPQRRRQLGGPRRGRLDLQPRSRRACRPDPQWAHRAARLLAPPPAPVLAVSPRIETVRRLNLLFGVQCVIAEDWSGITALLDECARLAKESGVAESGDLIGITAGLPGLELGTNLFEVHRVP